MRTQSDEDEHASVDMAAMMDAIFLMLIFFLVAATIQKNREQLPIELPSAQHPTSVVAPNDTLVLSVLRNQKSGQIEYAMSTIGERMTTTGGSREMVTFQEMINNLRELAAQNADRRIRIDADVNVPYGKISQLMDHLELYQLKDVGLRTKD